MKSNWTLISREEEHDMQFSGMVRAQQAARMETRRTHFKHQAFLTHTWRNLEPRLCWAVVLQMHWVNGNLETL